MPLSAETGGSDNVKREGIQDKTEISTEVTKAHSNCGVNNNIIKDQYPQAVSKDTPMPTPMQGVVMANLDGSIIVYKPNLR